MSIVVLKKNITKYFERHGVEIMCSLAALEDNSNAYENYLLLKRSDAATLRKTAY